MQKRFNSEEQKPEELYATLVRVLVILLTLLVQLGKTLSPPSYVLNITVEYMICACVLLDFICDGPTGSRRSAGCQGTAQIKQRHSRSLQGRSVTKFNLLVTEIYSRNEHCVFFCQLGQCLAKGVFRGHLTCMVSRQWPSSGVQKKGGYIASA